MKGSGYELILHFHLTSSKSTLLTQSNHRSRSGRSLHLDRQGPNYFCGWATAIQFLPPLKSFSKVIIQGYFNFF